MSRFASWPTWAARLTLVLLTSLVAYSAALRPADPRPVTEDRGRPPSTFSDGALYNAIADRVERGEGYYAAARAEQQAHGYPTTPAVVFREPTLSWVMALLRFDILRRAAPAALAAVAGLAIYRALRREGVAWPARAGAMVVLASGLGIVFQTQAYALHETWAALLIALSLAVYQPGRWRGALALGLAACLFRELALPYLLAMGGVALLESRQREAAGWAAGALAFAALFAVHLTLAAAQAGPHAAASPGWVGLGGVPFVIETVRRNAALALAPEPLVALIGGLGLIGLAGARHPVAARGAVIVAGYMAAFLVVGRPDNSYWGLLYAPILPLGLVLCPPAVRDLWRRATSGVGGPQPGRSPSGA